MEPRVWRLPLLLRLAYWALTLFCGGLVVLAAIAEIRVLLGVVPAPFGPVTSDLGFIVLVFGPLTWLTVRVTRMRAVASASGFEVRGVFRSWAIPWDELDRFGVRGRPPRTFRLVVVTKSSEVRFIPAFLILNSTRLRLNADQLRRAVEVLRAHRNEFERVESQHGSWADPVP